MIIFSQKHRVYLSFLNNLQLFKVVIYNIFGIYNHILAFIEVKIFLLFSSKWFIYSMYNHKALNKEILRVR